MSRSLTTTGRPLTGVIRVLVVDDSAVFRQSITAALNSLDGIEVIGTAGDGVAAIEAIERLQPDLVTLDVEMPVRDGIETLREIRRRRWSVPVLMVSSLTKEGAAVTIEALFLGAFDFIAKPTGGLVSGRQTLRRSLDQKIEAIRGNASADVQPSAVGPKPNRRLQPRRPPATTTRPCRLVVIGLSTGGPAALRTIVPRLNPDVHCPMVIVQHMPAGYCGSMADRLDEVSPIKVRLAAEGMPLRAGELIVAPGGRHTAVVGDAGGLSVTLTDHRSENGCRPSVDYTLRSAIAAVGGEMLVTILTGMGKDGLAGCTAAKDLGATIYAQDQTSSAVYGMPRAVIEAGLADRTLALGAVAPAINRYLRRSGGG